MLRTRNNYEHVMHEHFLTWYVTHFFGSGKITLLDARIRFMQHTDERKDRLCYYYYCSCI